MLSTKIRNTVVALAASSAVLAGGTLATEAGAFTIKYGTGHQSGETYSCAGAKTTFENAGTLLESDLKSGNVTGAASDIALGNAVKETAKEKGCDWAAMTAPLSMPSVKPVITGPVYALP
jgi:hypothetical protein